MTKPQNPLIFAHRGAMAYRPQNTLPAFELAWEMGAHGVELDVQCTRDGQVVVFHDDTLDALTDGSGRVRDYDFAQLMQLDAGAHFSAEYTGECIPTLAQVLRTRPMGRWVNIEIKTELLDATPEQLLERAIHGYPALLRAPDSPIELEAKRVAQRTAEVIRELSVQCPDLIECLIVSSFHPVAIQAFAQAFPNISLAYLYSSSMYFDTRPLMNAMTDVCLHAWHWDAQELTPELLSKAHQQGIRVNAWTVNDIAMAQRLLSMGVDGLFTNVPDILLAYLNTPIHLPDKMTTL